MDKNFSLSDEEVEKMVKDAEANASADKERKELVEAKNHADSAVYEAEKNLKEHGDKVDEETKKSIEDEVQKVKDVLAKEDAKAEDLKTATEGLVQSLMKIGEAVNSAAQAAAGSAGEAGAEGEAKSEDSSNDCNVDKNFF